ncbi:elongator complex protein 2-like [Ruditapes philippinarum]|uniref:elongator complex protein 2-like n=1 Tax=Ruditapes philippinarum TaxID=129788 RepID=UPI00295AFDC4|nr:elongator complex protein 2-like [Ruditapes philippinarum]
MAGIEACYISSGCNRTPHSADWGRNNVICYGSSNAIVLYQPEVKQEGKESQVLQTLTGHKGKVNCIKWIPAIDYGDETELVSGSVDKTVIVWQKHNHTYKAVQVLIGHSAPVTALEAVYVCAESDKSGQGRQLSKTILITASVDSTVKVWTRLPDQDFMETQFISYGSGFALDLSLIVIPNTTCLMLACACDDMKVHVYTEQGNADQSRFVSSMTLSGHEDWVRAVDFTVDDSGDVLLASAAQDYLIRVWRFAHRDTDTGSKINSILDLPIDKDIQMRENTFSLKYKDTMLVYAVSLETVLSGHENWIYTVKWKPPALIDGKQHQEMCLLSVSMDKTMILWEPESESGVWTEQMRVGEVGGNTLGLYGGMFGCHGDAILAHGYQGAFHQWARNKELDIWEHMITCSGHFDSVEDIEWDKKGGNFLLSCSLDETVRLHAPYVKNDRKVFWYEIARPQIHGYSIQCLAMINRYQYASGADEKVVRVFDAPDNFIENFCNLCGVNFNEECKSIEAKNRPVGASVPALGLSNKAIFTGGGTTNLTEDLEIKPGDNEQYSDTVFTQTLLKAPPSEEHLLQNTLWPEVQKLYGHGYEIFALACDPQGKVLASACKAAKAEFASVILWDTVTWQQICVLEGHNLTVTQIVFSHSGEYILTVSRDRTWFLYKRKGADCPESDPLFSCIASVDKKTCLHSRIIWSCCWSHDDKYFATASRDKKVIVWQCPVGSDVTSTAVSKLELPDSVTAIHSAPVFLHDGSYLFAVGLENGHILLYSWSLAEPSSWKHLTTLDNNTAHHMTVKRLKFRPCLGLCGIHGDDPTTSKVKDSDNWLQLASCSADHSVKIFDINLQTFLASSSS